MDAVVNTLTTKAELGFADAFERVKASLPGAESPWVREMRSEAFRAFERSGLPHRRIEEWKYTDLHARLDEAYAPGRATTPALSEGEVLALLGVGMAGLACHLVVIVDGVVVPELSDLSFLSGRGDLLCLAQALDSTPDWLQRYMGVREDLEPGAVLNLNTALMSDGVALRLAAGTEIEKPIHLVHVHAAVEPVGVAMRHVIRLEQDASATVLESHVSKTGGPAQHNLSSLVSLAKGAAMTHLKVQQEGAATTHLSTWRVGLEEKAQYRAFQFTSGAGLVRNQIHLRFGGEGAHADVSGTFLGCDRQHLDTTLFIDHAVANCRSRMLFKGVLDGEARGIFQGKIMVHQKAQKTDSKEMAHALLLSERAEFDSKPELEIFADDVVCGHGSTSGQIDDEMMFYLRARGIGVVEARSLLIQAFAGEALDLIENETIQAALVDAVRGWLGGRAA